jgi:transcriptional regulator with XRE-family HTH domain
MGSALRDEGRRGHRRKTSGQPGPRDSSDAGVVLAEFMGQEGLTHAELADRLGVDRTYVSKVLSGSRQIRDVGRLRQVARTIGVPPERFGLLPEPEETSVGGHGHSLAANVRADVDAWRKVRATLNHRRPNSSSSISRNSVAPSRASVRKSVIGWWKPFGITARRWAALMTSPERSCTSST